MRLIQLIDGLKETGRWLFGSNYEGHRAAYRFFMTVANLVCLAFVVVAGISLTYVQAVGLAAVISVLVWHAGLFMEIYDNAHPENSFNNKDLAGNTHGITEGLVLSVVLNVIVVFAL